MHHNFDQLFFNTSKIALAVSGGPDSIAMMHIIHNWALESKKEIIILTVNHNLRPEALSECDFVREFSQKLGLEHILLEWIHNGITSNVHDKAREARYDLMTGWCKNNNTDTLCTAHHMDDRVENFFIRVSKGAGILGLIDRQKITYNDIEIIRPLFEYSKAELMAYIDKYKLRYFVDKSNEDPKYLRTNIRRWLELLPAEIDRDLFKQRVIGVKENLLRSSEVIERIFEEELESKTTLYKDHATLSALPQDKEIACMVLSHLISQIGGNKSARLDSVQLLYSNLTSNNLVKSTLGGCIIEKRKGMIIFTKEAGRKKTKSNS